MDAPVLAFDIETIPDVSALRVMYNAPANEFTDLDVINLAVRRRRQDYNTDFLPIYLQKVVSIACVLREANQLHIWSIGEPDDTEPILIQRFFEGIERYTPQLVSWNGNGFDLPVLHARALIHKLRAPTYWDQGEFNREFKFNHYLGRYHSRHLDLMDILAGYQGKAFAPLDMMAKLCGFPGKMDIDGSQVWEAYYNGEIERIRHYCETDTVNTYLVFLRFQAMRGHLSDESYYSEIQRVKDKLSSFTHAGWQTFLNAGNWS
ncbi:MAG: 3'-5' exonuclease [Pseudomonadota bacterium]